MYYQYWLWFNQYSTLCFSANTGYANYKSNHITRYDIPVTLGLFGVRKVKWFATYSGVGFGLLYKNEETTSTENVFNTISNDEVKALWYITFGSLIQISESLSLDLNFKNYWVFKDLDQSKISIGLSYSF
jgi:hypothetical protein